MAAVCSFPSIEAAVTTTIQIIQMGVPIARCELLDTNAVRAVNKHDKLTLREGPMLLMEFHGTPSSVKEQVATVEDIAREQGGLAFEWASTPEERTRLWTARHHAYFAGMQMRPGCRTVTTDTCVPISHLAECLLATVAEVEASGLPYYIVGHVGDGNFHVAYLIDPLIPQERETAEQLNLQLVQRALSLDGTCTGRDDAHREARARPEKHHEPGEDFFDVRPTRAQRSTMRAPRNAPPCAVMTTGQLTTTRVGTIFTQPLSAACSKASSERSSCGVLPGSHVTCTSTHNGL
jgi:FAD/FMN-containing dehydrogenase